MLEQLEYTNKEIMDYILLLQPLKCVIYLDPSILIVKTLQM